MKCLCGGKIARNGTKLTKGGTKDGFRCVDCGVEWYEPKLKVEVPKCLSA